jgi:tripartite-type tricarboxylate transporter receptor subunit TctC
MQDEISGTPLPAPSTGRRALVKLLAGAGALAAAPWVARPALAAPRVVTFICPFAPGGVIDVQMRVLAAALSTPERSVVVDNRAGASGAVGSRAFARARPDGSVLGFAGQGTLITNAYMLKGYEEEVTRKLVPLHGTTGTPMIFAISSALPFKTMGEFVAHAKAHPKEVNIACIGTGTGGWQIFALIRDNAGFQTTDVPFSGTAACINAVLGGQCDAIAAFPPDLKPHLESGKLRALGITMKERHPLLPDIPTFLEQGIPDSEMLTWWGIFGPPGLPQPLVESWSKELGEVMRRKDIVDTFRGQGTTVFEGLDHIRFPKFIQAETPRWLALAQKVGLKQES